MSILPTETRASIRTEIARSIPGALVVSAVVDSATATTLIAAAELGNYVSADALKGLQVVPKSGTSAVVNNERLISASTTPGGQITVLAWEASATPVIGDTFDIYDPRIADLSLLNQALKFAIEKGQRQFAPGWEDSASIVFGSIISNGGFEDWTSGAPDKWTKVETASTWSKESTIIQPPFRYSCKFANANAAVGTLRQQNNILTYPWDLLASKSMTMSALLYCTTAARVTLRWTSDGSTYHSSSAHGGTGWEKLTVAAADVGATPTELTAELRISTGSVVTTYVHDFRFIPDIDIFDYYLPAKFLRLGAIWRETGTDFEWNRYIAGDDWDIDLGRERIMFDKRYWSPPGEYRAKLVGQTYQAVPTADSDAIDMPVSYLIAQARSYIVQMGRGGDDVQRQSGTIHAEAEAQHRRLHTWPIAFGKLCR